MKKVISSLQNKAKGLVIFIAFNTLTMFAPVSHAQTSPYNAYGIKDADVSKMGHGFIPKNQPHSKAELAEIMSTGDESKLVAGVTMEQLQTVDLVTLKHYRDEAGGWLVIDKNGDTAQTAVEPQDIPWFIDLSVESDQQLPEIFTTRVEEDGTITTYMRKTNDSIPTPTGFRKEHTLWFNPNLIPGIIPNPMDANGKYALVPWKSLWCGNAFIVKKRAEVQPPPTDDGVLTPPPVPTVQTQTAPAPQVMQAPPVPIVQAQADAGFRFQWGVSYGYSPQIAYSTIPYQSQANCCAGNSYSYAYSYDDHSTYELNHNTTTTQTITYNIVVIDGDTTIIVDNDSITAGWGQEGNGGVDTVGNGNGGVDTTGNGDTPLDGGKKNIVKNKNVASVTPHSNEVRPTQNVPKKEEVKNQSLASVPVKTQPSVESSIYAPKPQLIKTSTLGETPKVQVKNNTEAAVIHPITPKQITNNSDVAVTPKSNVGIKNDYGFNPATVVGGIKNPVKGNGEIQNSLVGQITPSQGKPNFYANNGVGSIDGLGKQQITKANTAIGSIDQANPYLVSNPKTTAVSTPGVGGIRNETFVANNSTVIGSIKTETASNTNVGGIKNVRTDKGVGSISDIAPSTSVGSIPNTTTASTGRPFKGGSNADSRMGSIK